MTSHVVDARPLSLVTKFATKYSVEPERLLVTLKATAFKQKADAVITNEQMMALLIVADQYGLNPFTKEIYAYPDKQNGIVPVVGVDGWSRIINENPQADGIEFAYSDQIVTMAGGKPCPDWCEVHIHRKDRSRPVVVREYLDEVYRQLSYPSPWQSHTKRMLRHKALIQGARIAFGFVGIYDEDEAERILERNMGDAEQVQREAPAPYWTAEKFDASISKWADLIVSGTRTPDEVIAMAGTKGALSEAQRAAIVALKPTEQAE
jgi:phage recombination protein Bet